MGYNITYSMAIMDHSESFQPMFEPSQFSTLWAFWSTCRPIWLQYHIIWLLWTSLGPFGQCLNLVNVQHFGHFVPIWCPLWRTRQSSYLLENSIVTVKKKLNILYIACYVVNKPSMNQTMI
jgi:hypothetical protein